MKKATHAALHTEPLHYLVSNKQYCVSVQSNIYIYVNRKRIDASVYL